MRLVLVTQNAPLYLGVFLGRLFALLAESPHDVVGVVAFRPTFNNTLLQEVRQRLAYYGPSDFVRMAGHIAGNQVRARLANRWPRFGCYSLQNALNQYGIRRLECGDVNHPDFHEYLRRENVDVVLSVASPKIFKQALLSTPRCGCINYHTGYLPRYRGRQPLFWALLHDEPVVGITVHEMDQKLDNGPILCQTTVPVDPEDTLHGLYLKTIAKGPDLVVKALDVLGDPEAPRLPNDETQASYFSFPDSAAVAEFRAKRKRFF